jgi:hypothetical protein
VLNPIGCGIAHLRVAQTRAACRGDAAPKYYRAAHIYEAIEKGSYSYSARERKDGHHVDRENSAEGPLEPTRKKSDQSSILHSDCCPSPVVGDFGPYYRS